MLRVHLKKFKSGELYERASLYPVAKVLVSTTFPRNIFRIGQTHGLCRFIHWNDFFVIVGTAGGVTASERHGV